MQQGLHRLSLSCLSVGGFFAAVFAGSLISTEIWRTHGPPVQPLGLALSSRSVSFNGPLGISQEDLAFSDQGPSSEHHIITTSWLIRFGFPLPPCCVYFSKHHFNTVAMSAQYFWSSFHCLVLGSKICSQKKKTKQKQTCRLKQQKKKGKGTRVLCVSLQPPLLCSPAGRAVHGGITWLFDWENANTTHSQHVHI